MNDCLVVYIERDAACGIDNEIIMHQFQNMQTYKRHNCKFYVFTCFFLLLLLLIYEFLFLLDYIFYTF